VVDGSARVRSVIFVFKVANYGMRSRLLTNVLARSCRGSVFKTIGESGWQLVNLCPSRCCMPSLVMVHLDHDVIPAMGCTCGYRAVR
jgi:hypothetical protein